MKPDFKLIAFLSLLISSFSCQPSFEPHPSYDIIILGGGTGGAAAGLQAARQGARTLIIESTPWLGGMLTAAGVSATDGNHKLPAGIWGAFRQKIWNHYGGPDSVATGWVSNTQFEPSVGAAILKEMASATPLLTLMMPAVFSEVKQTGQGWQVKVQHGDTTEIVTAKILIDGTDLGDVAALVGVDFDLGMDNRSISGEAMAPETSNQIIQDFTYTAILKDFGRETDKTIPAPPNYDPGEFECACAAFCPDLKPGVHPCATMMSYAKLPHDKYLINWPIQGNDYFADIVPLNEAERQVVYEAAKARTLRFIYFIQHELGYKHLGLAEDEFPTQDLLPLIPYHREGRRIKGIVRMNVNHILEPYQHQPALYRTGIAVGDYPIDHHHGKNPQAPEIDFPPVPSFNIPVGALLPKEVDNFIVADKAISVTNIVNGSTRLQPVVLQIGQAAGALAALAIEQHISPKEVSIRHLQQTILDYKGYLLPFMDVLPEDPQFEIIQKIGATGILKGQGVPYQWANQTWFYPDSLIKIKDFLDGLKSFAPNFRFNSADPNRFMDLHHTLEIFVAFAKGQKLKHPALTDMETFSRDLLSNKNSLGFPDTEDFSQPFNRRTLAILLHHYVAPFEVEVDFNGLFMR